MDVLIIGGTGLISRGIATHLAARGARMTFLNRGRRGEHVPPGVEVILADRDDEERFVAALAARRFDVVIDMICFRPEQARATLRAIAGRCRHLIFCSTVCTYGVEVPPQVLVDERFEQRPISPYGRDKLACERIVLEAHGREGLAVTVVRPSHTYGPGAPLICNVGWDTPTWDRVARGMPVLCAGDGLGLWVSTHRDDVGAFFAHAALAEPTYGRCFNATREDVVTWRDYYRCAAAALGVRAAHVLFAPAAWIVRHDPQRFAGLAEIFAWHGAYTSRAARAAVPAFRPEIALQDGMRATLDDQRRRGAWKRAEDDALYQRMIDELLVAGERPVALEAST